MAQAPQLALRWGWAEGLALITLGVLAGSGFALWRTTRFS
jgi:hypothetical protein